MRTRGSVLVEVLSVLFMLGVFAVVAIPDLGDKPPDPRPQALQAALDEVRTAFDRFQGDHDGSYPRLEALQLLENPSRFSGTRLLVGYLDGIPDNPFTNGNHVESAATATGDSDWVYDSATGVFKANDCAEHRAM